MLPKIQVLAADTIIPQLKYWRKEGLEDHFTEAHLDEMVATYNAQVHEAPVTLDHVQEGPAFGWVNRIERQGKALFAELRDVSEDLVGLVRQKKYKKISAEVDLDFQNSGKMYFSGVSFLGAGKPAVKGMADPLLAEDGRLVAFLNEKTKTKTLCVPTFDLAEKVFGEETKPEPKGATNMPDTQDRDLLPVEIENRRLREEKAELEKERAEVLRKRKLERIDAALTEQVKAGKLTPAQRKPLETILALLPEIEIPYGDKKMTPMAILLEFVEKQPTSIYFSPTNLGPDTNFQINKANLPRGIDPDMVDPASARLAEVIRQIQIRDKCDYQTAMQRADREHPEIYAATVQNR